MFVALLIEYAVRIRRIILSSMVFWLYHIFPHFSQMAQFSAKKKKYLA